MSSEEFNKILAGIPNKELVEKIHNHLTDMCKNREVFTMTIPPDPYRDFDILLGELIRRFNKQSLPVEAQVMQKPAGKKEFSMKEILISALAEMEKKLYMVLLKNGKKFEYYDSDFENTDFDEYTLDEHYDPDRGINIIEMRKP